jgi:hypothetical protein
VLGKFSRGFGRAPLVVLVECRRRVSSSSVFVVRRRRILRIRRPCLTRLASHRLATHHHHFVITQGSAVPAPPPTPPLWPGSGCPSAYVIGATVAPGGSVTVTKDGISLVYTCASYPASGWCPLVGYEPGTGIAWQQA